MHPKARTQNLTIRELPGETVIYDLATMKVHCLNRVALFVWKHSDGRTAVGDLATGLADELSIPSAYEAVELALEQLSKRGLLEKPFADASAARKSDRRAVLRRLAALAAVPTILTLAVPNAMASASSQCAQQAASGNKNECARKANGASCTYHYCSGQDKLFTSSGVCRSDGCEFS